MPLAPGIWVAIAALLASWPGLTRFSAVAWKTMSRPSGPAWLSNQQSVRSGPSPESPPVVNCQEEGRSLATPDLPFTPAATWTS